MIDNVSFTLDGWEKYTAWQTEDKRTIRKINNLAKDNIKNGNKGIVAWRVLRDNTYISVFLKIKTSAPRYTRNAPVISIINAAS